MRAAPQTARTLAKRQLSRLVDDERVDARREVFAGPHPRCPGGYVEFAFAQSVHELGIRQGFRSVVQKRVVIVGPLADAQRPAGLVGLLQDLRQNVVDDRVRRGCDTDGAPRGGQRQDRLRRRVGLSRAGWPLDGQVRVLQAQDQPQRCVVRSLSLSTQRPERVAVTSRSAAQQQRGGWIGTAETLADDPLAEVTQSLRERLRVDRTAFR